MGLFLGQSDSVRNFISTERLPETNDMLRGFQVCPSSSEKQINTLLNSEKEKDRV